MSNVPEELKMIICPCCIEGDAELRFDKKTNPFYYCRGCSVRIWSYAGGVRRLYRIYLVSQLILAHGRDQILATAHTMGLSRVTSPVDRVKAQADLFKKESVSA